MSALIINHTIHLNKEQRYKLHNGKPINAVGYFFISSLEKKLKIDNKEFFCNYLLKNEKINIPLKILEDGFEIMIPYRKGTNINISNEEWLDLKMNNPLALEDLYSRTIPEVSSENLLDIKDKGARFLFYREKNKTNIDSISVNIFHHVVITCIEELEESLIIL